MSNYSEFVDLAEEHAPRFAAPYRCVAQARDRDWIGFKLACKCGEERFNLVGAPDDDLKLCSPITTECTACAEQHVLFDARTHGYDAEYGHGSSYQNGAGEEIRLGCDKCGAFAIRVEALVSYQFESLAEFEGIAMERIPDFFDVFNIELVCDACDQVGYIGPFELS